MVQGKKKQMKGACGQDQGIGQTLKVDGLKTASDTDGRWSGGDSGEGEGDEGDCRLWAEQQ